MFFRNVKSAAEFALYWYVTFCLQTNIKIYWNFCILYERNLEIFKINKIKEYYIIFLCNFCNTFNISKNIHIML